MFKKNNYSEKEIEIFKGLGSLLQGGANPYSITVAEIAQASNIGKGTVYSYFTSKEELISKAISYNMDQEIDLANRRIREKKSFKEMYYESLDILEENFKDKKTILNLLLSTGGIKELYECMLDQEKIHDFFRLTNRAIGEYLEIGKKEGIVKSDHSNFYQVMVVRGAISSFIQYISQTDFYKQVDIDRAKDYSYKILIKALN